MPQIILIAIAALVGVAALWFWIAMFLHCLRNTPARSRQRRVWLPIVALGKLPGALSYYLLARELGGQQIHPRS